MSITIDDQGWIKEATGIYYGADSFGPFAPGQPKWLVLHGTAWPGGTADIIANSWASEVARGQLGAATHCIIDKSGYITQGITLLNTGAGNSGAAGSGRAPYLPAGNLNFVTISVEHCKYDAVYNSDTLTPQQQDTSFAFIKACCDKYPTIKRNVVTIQDCSQGGIIRHYDCDQKNRPFCPGPYPLADLQNFLNGGPSMFSDQLCIQIWESNFKATGRGVPLRDRGIFDEWRAQWLAGHFKGAPLTDEYPVTLPSGKPSVAQNFAGGTCVWNGGNPIWL